MSMNRALLTLSALLVLSACATTAKPPKAPDGPGKPINSPAAIAALSRVLGTIEPDEQRRREHARAVLFLPEPKTVRVPFRYASTAFEPSPETAKRVLALAKTAARIEARGRMHGIGDPEQDRDRARLRAESARRYLVVHGANPETIAVTYRGADRPAEDGARLADRRVDLVFWPELPSTGETR